MFVCSKFRWRRFCSAVSATRLVSSQMMSHSNILSFVLYLAFLIGITGLGFMVAMIRNDYAEAQYNFFEPNDSLFSRCDSCIISPGEDLTYEVSWWVFKIGQIKLKTLESKTINGKRHYSAAAFIDSYSGLPFVDLHAIDYSEMDSAFFSRGFRAIEKRNHEWLVENSHFDYPNKMMIIERSRQKDLQSAPYTTPEYDTVALDRSGYLDGLSMLFYTRANAHCNIALRVPTIVYAKKGSISFYFNDKKTTETIDAMEKPVRVVQLEGKADFEGIFGFTGDFKSWLSDDSATVPIKAEMKVILGSINIELKKWERAGWSPPVENTQK
jgi:hypothetical protein